MVTAMLMAHGNGDGSIHQDSVHMLSESCWIKFRWQSREVDMMSISAV
jgi:hypothetical protein